MQTPKLHRWNRTHGGPYSVEVGKNTKIDYTTREVGIVSTFFNTTTNVSTPLYGE
jgi:hypothetical protein